MTRPLLPKPRALVRRGPIDYDSLPLPRLNEIAEHWRSEDRGIAIMSDEPLCGEGRANWDRRAAIGEAISRKLLDN